ACGPGRRALVFAVRSRNTGLRKWGGSARPGPRSIAALRRLQDLRTWRRALLEDVAEVDRVRGARNRALFVVELAALRLRKDDPNLLGASSKVRFALLAQLLDRFRGRNDLDADFGRAR